VAAIPCDLTEPDGPMRFVREARTALGPIDILVNNAATMVVGPLDTMTDADFERSMQLHFYVPLRLVRAVLPEMRARGIGRIVNVCSVGGRVSPPHMLPYNAGKFAKTGLSEGLRAELAGTGVLVTTVCPGLTRTGSPRHVSFKGRFRREHGWFAVSDSLPFVSGDAMRTARRIADAAESGRADLITTIPARFGIAFHGLFPGLTANLFGLVQRLLPTADGAGAGTVPGRASASRWAPSLLTRLSDRAAVELNQVPGAPSLRRKRTT
jgi:NAD(P)-dependent dehydrogenase (short-subunit alcohol dehydrogenase family)